MTSESTHFSWSQNPTHTSCALGSTLIRPSVDQSGLFESEPISRNSEVHTAPYAPKNFYTCLSWSCANSARALLGSVIPVVTPQHDLLCCCLTASRLPARIDSSPNVLPVFSQALIAVGTMSLLLVSKHSEATEVDLCWWRSRFEKNTQPSAASAASFALHLCCLFCSPRSLPSAMSISFRDIFPSVFSVLPCSAYRPHRKRSESRSTRQGLSLGPSRVWDGPVHSPLWNSKLKNVMIFTTLFCLHQ